MKDGRSALRQYGEKKEGLMATQTKIVTQQEKFEENWFSRTFWGRTSKLKRREAIDGFLMALPWIIGFILFTAGPMLAAVYFSLTRWDIISPARYVGLDNFVTMFTRDELFAKSLWVTVQYTLMAVPLHVIFGFILALLLNIKFFGNNFFRSVFYLPSVLPLVATAVLFSWIFNPEFGLLNYALAVVGIQGPGWLTSEEWALPAIVIMNIQFIGFTMVIMLAALQRVPQELLEAAQLDGAGRLRILRHITIPMVSPVIFLIVIININNSFQTFTQAFVMTNGGPANSTLFYMLHLYNNAFRFFKMGYASALAWILFFIIVVFTIVQFRLSRLWVYEE
jgi:multiple sugar transport system permease protein